MTELRAWLSRRVPAPPSDLAVAVEASVSDSPVSPDAPAALVESANALLREVRDRPGVVRDAAFDLLVADALVTYACESALEEADPEAALLAVLQSVGAP